MLLENIREFNWLNEPQNVGFIEEGILITTKPQTDFWQSVDYNFFKDNGHFFATSKEQDFSAVTKWHFSSIKDSAQCGIMARSDAQNWLKAGILSPNPTKPQLGVVVSNQGSSDWSVIDLPTSVKDIWLKIRRRGNDFIVCYSLDGQTFNQIRMLHLPKILRVIDIGAYACSPKDESFECILEDIDIK